jgi:hypothetical protein
MLEPPPIGRVVDTIIGGNLLNVEWVDTLEAAHVVAVLLGVGAALMVRVDTANGTEIVFGCSRIELIDLEHLGALEDMKTAERDRCHDGSSAATV